MSDFDFSTVKIKEEKDIKVEPDSEFNLSNDHLNFGGNDLQVIDCKIESEELLPSVSQNIHETDGEITVEKVNIRVPLTYIKKESKEAKSILQTRNIRLPFSCDKCNYETVHKQNFKQHMLNHLGYKLFECSYCHFKTNYKSSFQVHIQQKHPDKAEKTLKCNKCDFTCFSNKDLIVHKYAHLSKRFNCDNCSYSTNSSERFESHKLTHLGTKKYKCDMCNFETNYGKWLDTHLSKHSNTKSYKCSDCDYVTNYKMFFDKHSLRHSDLVLLKCPKCEYKTTNKYKLNKHKRIYKHDN